MRVDFYHWGAQCPLVPDMLGMLLRPIPGFTVHVHDIHERPALARQMRMFFPFLTVLQGSRRFFRPVTPDFFDAIRRGRPVRESPQAVESAEVPYSGGELVPIEGSTVRMACTCAGACTAGACMQKAAFLSSMTEGTHGFLLMDGPRVYGGAEYVPSLFVPYDIPRDAQTAFITCTYHAGAAQDARSAPLEALEAYLARRFARVLLVADEESAFPNGTVRWFAEHGYADKGVLSEEPGYARLHLMEKALLPEP